MFFASGLLPATIAVAQECLRLPFVALRALLGAPWPVCMLSWSPVMCWRLHRVASDVRGARERSRWSSLGVSRSSQMPLKARELLSCSRAFVMVLAVETSLPYDTGSCVQAWLPMSRIATSERHARTRPSRLGRNHLRTSCLVSGYSWKMATLL